MRAQSRQLILLLSIVPMWVLGCSDAPADDGAGTASDVTEVSDTAADGALDDAAPDDVTISTEDTSAQPDTAIVEAPDFGQVEPMGAFGEFGPIGRMTRLDVPDTPRAAQRLGCLVYGDKMGSPLGNLVVLAGGVDQFLRPDAEGFIQVILYVAASGWAEGQSADDLESIDLAMLRGSQTEDREFTILPESYIDDDPSEQPRTHFPDTELQAGGWFTTPVSSFPFTFPVLQDYFLTVRVEVATMRGRAVPSPPGLGIESGVITGYVTRDSIASAAGTIRDDCYGDGPRPAVCNLIGGQIQPDQTDDEILEFLMPLTGDFDVLLEDGVPRECDASEEACNAFGLCIAFAAEGVDIAGLAD